MNRPLHVWTAFVAAALVLLGAVTWLTATALRLEQAQAEAQRAAEFEEKVRLALWRMDSLLTPVIVEESARPAIHYHAFENSGEVVGTIEGAALAYTPSPLWFQLPPHARLYFELKPNGVVDSPEVFPDFLNASYRAALLKNYATTQDLQLAAARLSELKKLLAEPAAEPSQFAEVNNGAVLSNAAATAATNSNPLNFTNALLAANQAGEQALPQAFNVRPSEIRQQSEQAQVWRNSAEYQARANVYQQVAQAGNRGQLQMPLQARSPRPPTVAVSEGPMTPVWLGSALVLARKVNTGNKATIQGVWLNWDWLRQTLLENTRDLFPSAELRAAPSTNSHSGRRLAALPVEFAPGAMTQGVLPPWTSTRLTLAFAWGCMLLAILAVAFVLHGTVSLSERRGAFVSAVTHELRTPLTTFKMYSEMLAAGMVSDEEKRQQYLATLCSEANRLSHLVENVLAYARLERGSARRRVERVTLGSLIERILPRLQERAERSGMTIVLDSTEGALGAVAHVDAAAVEQILFNLVDNACKYAAPNASEKLIHLEAWPSEKFALLRVRDHGQGISAEGAKRLFKPFSKSAQEAAHSAPGVGLGLALCRRLSRSIGGDLRLAANATRGACFELRLPLGASADAADLSSI